MANQTQMNRYKNLLVYLNKNFKEEINIPTVEEICYYSYRNINRIFEALHHETIGKYIKRLRLDKAAEFLKYSNHTISEIAEEVGFGDIASFSKAFKNRFNCSPSAFRISQHAMSDLQKIDSDFGTNEPLVALKFEVEVLPDFHILGLEYKGSYQDVRGIEETWKKLEGYAIQNGLINSDTIFLGEILDDDAITEVIYCRYTAAIILKNTKEFLPEGLFITKQIKRKKYAKFIHRGPHEHIDDTYKLIYGNWMQQVKLDFLDAPTLEFYLNDPADTPADKLLTEIYIPVV